VTWEIGAIAADKYAVLTYQIKTPTTTSTAGQLEFNATWDGDRGIFEAQRYEITTANYTTESHLEFDLEIIQQGDFPQPEVRSAQLNKTYNYSLKTTNIGDIAITDDWNISITIPAGQCNITNISQEGTFDANTEKIEWDLPALAVRASSFVNFTLNCTIAGDYTLTAQGTKDNTTTFNATSNPDITCNQATCPITNTHTFSKPAGTRYEKLRNINFYINYSWAGQNVTIGNAYVNITDDDGKPKRVWQNHTFSASPNTELWINHTLDESERSRFTNDARDIAVSTYTSATDGASGNITVQTINYTWESGKVFEEPQDLFIKIKKYTYTPLLQNATLYVNASNSTILGGWGETFNFSVQTRDRFGRNVTVFALHKKTGEEFTEISNDTCVDCEIQTGMNFTFDYNGSDVAAVDGWTFKFNATNPDGDTQLAGFTYTVEEDDVNATIFYPTPNVFVNRSNTTVFSINVYDADNRTYLDGASQGQGEITISISGTTSFETSPDTINAESGYINRTMTNGGTGKNSWCDNTGIFFLGLHAWKGGIRNTVDTYVKANITPQSLSTLPSNCMVCPRV